jgi:Protein of unknown function (DUF5674)
MKQVDKISIKELKEMAERMYEPLVKAVVDIRQKKIVVDAEMHVDEEQFLLENGSKQNDLWGINLYPDKFGSDDFIEYDSMVNIRPSQDNPSREVQSEEVRAQIEAIVKEVVHE